MADKRLSSSSAQGQTDERPLLLVIDDDPLFQKQIDFILTGCYRVEQSLGVVANDSYALTHADTIILDLNMPGIDGLSFIKTVATLNPKPKLLIASGHDEAILELARSSAFMYGLSRTEVLRKPIGKASLLRALDQLDRMPTEATLRSALVQTFSHEQVIAGFDSGQFIVAYQPQVALSTLEIAGFEALARWDHPEFGCLSPAHFIEQVEDSRIAEEFTLAIAAAAVADARKIDALGQDGYKISINVPPQVLESESFAERLFAQLDDSGFPPQRFQCEITERGMENPKPAVSASLARLRMKGVQLSLDDFGIGQSGLSKVKSRAFDEIKIDRSFIRDLAFSAESRSIVESMVQLSKSVGLRIVAEGVEDQGTVDCIRSLGINAIQGYFYARPMTLDLLATWLREWEERRAALPETSL